MREKQRSRRAAGTLAVIAGLAAGTIASNLGALTGALTGGEGAGPAGMPRAAGSPTTPGMSQPKLDLLHTPPLLVLRSEAVELRYELVCPAEEARCAPEGTAYLRAECDASFTALPLRPGGASRQDRWYVRVPRRFLAGSSFFYYAVMGDRESGLPMTLPAGGAAGPQQAWVLDRPHVAELGAHRFGRTRPPRGGGRPGGVGSRRRRARPAGRPRSGNRGPFLVRRRERWLGAHPRPGQPPLSDLPAGHGDPPGPGRAAGHLRGDGRPGDRGGRNRVRARPGTSRPDGGAGLRPFGPPARVLLAPRRRCRRPAPHGPERPCRPPVPGRDLAAGHASRRALSACRPASGLRSRRQAGDHPTWGRSVRAAHGRSGCCGDPGAAARGKGGAGGWHEGAGRMAAAELHQPRRARAGRAAWRRARGGRPRVDRDAGRAAGSPARTERRGVRLRRGPGRVGAGAAVEPLSPQRLRPPLPTPHQPERRRGRALGDRATPMTPIPCRRGGFLLGLALAASLWAPPAQAAGGNFVARSCNRNAATKLASWSRSQAMSYASVAADEGYQWGGGCWNDNNRDDQPGDQEGVLASNGEGPDCSGLVFKSWTLAGDPSGADTGFYRHDALTYVHGPFSANAFKTRNLNAFGPDAKASAVSMDAFASSQHIGLVYQANADGTDQIVEAIGESDGTRIATESFRGNPDFSAVHRKAWSA